MYVQLITAPIKIINTVWRVKKKKGKFKKKIKYNSQQVKQSDKTLEFLMRKRKKLHLGNGNKVDN